MVDPGLAGVAEAAVPESVWRDATISCHPLRVGEVIRETRDANSVVLEVPDELTPLFRYQPGQFLSFKIPVQGMVLTRSYSLASSPDCDEKLKFTVKRVDDGRVSNWINDSVKPGDTLMVTPPAGLFVLGASSGRMLLFAGGSGITPVISIIKSALATTQRSMKLVYANRDAQSIIFQAELEALAAGSGGRFELVHSLDDVAGFLDLDAVKRDVGGDVDADFYLCGPGAFMATVEEALRELEVDPARIHIERFVSPPDPDHLPAAEEDTPDTAAAAGDEATPTSVTVLLDGETHDVPYEKGERILHAARRAGLEPPFSCEEGYCSCCMAKLISGEVEMPCLSRPDVTFTPGWCPGICRPGIHGRRSRTRMADS